MTFEALKERGSSGGVGESTGDKKWDMVGTFFGNPIRDRFVRLLLFAGAIVATDGFTSLILQISTQVPAKIVNGTFVCPDFLGPPGKLIKKWSASILIG